MSKKVRLEKIGTVTRVTEYYTENPLQQVIYNISDASLFSEKDYIVVDLVKKQLSFNLDEIENNYGSTTTMELMNQLAVRKYFVCDNGDDIGSLTYTVIETSNTVQLDELIGKESINLVFVDNTPNQNITGFNTEDGSFNFDVTIGDNLLIFYTN